MKIVFIVGASRSGTTMLNRVLGRNPSILALNELHYFGDVWPDVDNVHALPIAEAESYAAKVLSRERRDLWGGAPTSEDAEDARTIVKALTDDQRNPRDLFSTVVGWIANEKGKNLVSEQTPRNVFYAARLLDEIPQEPPARHGAALIFSSALRTGLAPVWFDAIPCILPSGASELTSHEAA